MNKNNGKINQFKVDGVSILELLLILLIPVVVQGILPLASIIPYAGGIFKELAPFVAFYIFFTIGQYSGDKAKWLSLRSGYLLIGYVLIVCTVTFASPYLAGYYTYPVKVTRSFAAEKHVNLNYEQASNTAKEYLRQETGSDGVIAYAIYSARPQLSAHSYGEYVSRQFDDIDDLGGFIAAGINIVLHTIPIFLTWILCFKLGWVGEAGLVGLGFWYLFYVGLCYIGYWVSKS